MAGKAELALKPTYTHLPPLSIDHTHTTHTLKSVEATLCVSVGGTSKYTGVRKASLLEGWT